MKIIEVYKTTGLTQLKCLNKGIHLKLPLIFCVSILISCQKDLQKPETQRVEIESPVQGGGFIIEAEQITETEDGISFTGLLSTKTDEGKVFPVGEGKYDIVKNSDGTVKSIKGVGMAEFPKIGLFAELLKTHTWELIKAHIEYETGQYYIDKYHTDIPLGLQTKYLFFKVFDESKDGNFQLRDKLNKFKNNFREFYIDPLDPAILLKGELAFPEDPIFVDPKEWGYLYWQSVLQGTQEIAGELLKNVPIDQQLIMGISNQGRFRSKPYEFKPIEEEFFNSKIGFNAFEEAPSHFYLKIKDWPIKSTYGILQATGEMYLHPASKTLIPIPGESLQESYEYVIDFLKDEKDYGHMININGSIDPLGNPVVDGIFNSLGEFNDIVGIEIFNAGDIDLDLLGATYQFQRPELKSIVSDAAPSFTRFAGQSKSILLRRIFGPAIQQYLTPHEGTTYSNLYYLHVGELPSDFKLFIEGGVNLNIPYIGDINFGTTAYFIDASGIEMLRSKAIDILGISLNKGLRGKIGPNEYSLTGQAGSKIVINDDIEINPINIEATIDNVNGLSFKGEAALPFGLGDAVLEGRKYKDSISLSGELKVGSEIDLGNGLKLSSAEMKFNASTNRGFELEGKLNGYSGSY